jgi:hypothetical protein
VIRILRIFSGIGADRDDMTDFLKTVMPFIKRDDLKLRARVNRYRPVDGMTPITL